VLSTGEASARLGGLIAFPASRCYTVQSSFIRGAACLQNPKEVVLAQTVLGKERIMLIVHVHVHVKADQVQAFRAASVENAKQSVREPGVARFDVIQQQDDPSRFILVEVYRTADDPARHKETAHYKKWRDTVESMMAEPRRSVKFSNVFPDEEGWDAALAD
jgi:autoinducer 2-degrading protein